MALRTLRDLDFSGKKVLLRVDYNVPIKEDGEVADNTRIEESLPTVKHLLRNKAAVILLSHLGRPKGKADSRFSLRPLAQVLQSLIQQRVEFVEDCVGFKAEQASSKLQSGRILMLENLRFHSEEKKNDEAFAKSLSGLGDCYVNDAFSASHRAHASIVGIPKWKPGAAGSLFVKELEILTHLLENPRRPYLALLGGAKISDKLSVIKSLAARVDGLLLGGAMAFTFLKALGYQVGNSLVEDGFLVEANELLKSNSGKIKLPFDCLAAHSVNESESSAAIAFSKDRDEMRNLSGFDLGPASIENYKEYIRRKQPGTVFWNGPMGVFEVPRFARGTLEMAKVLAELAEHGTEVVVGGGDSLAAVKQLGLAMKISNLLSGGGASLEFLEGKTLPGIAALEQRISTR